MVAAATTVSNFQCDHSKRNITPLPTEPILKVMLKFKKKKKTLSKC